MCHAHGDPWLCGVDVMACRGGLDLVFRVDRKGSLFGGIDGLCSGFCTPGLSRLMGERERERLA